MSVALSYPEADAVGVGTPEEVGGVYKVPVTFTWSYEGGTTFTYGDVFSYGTVFSGGPETVDAYHIQVATDEGFSIIVIDEEVAIEESGPHMLDPSTAYWWRVRAGVET